MAIYVNATPIYVNVTSMCVNVMALKWPYKIRRAMLRGDGNEVCRLLGIKDRFVLS